MRGDLIEVFKIITNTDNNGNCTSILYKGLVKRGNRYKLYQKHVNYDLRKYFTFLFTGLSQYGTVHLIMLYHSTCINIF